MLRVVHAGQYISLSMAAVVGLTVTVATSSDSLPSGSTTTKTAPSTFACCCTVTSVLRKRSLLRLHHVGLGHVWA